MPKTVFGTFGFENGKFSNPNGIGVEPSSPNFIYVADTGNNRTQKFDAAGNFVNKVFSGINSRNDGFMTQFRLSLPDLTADSLDTDSSGKFLVSDWSKEEFSRLDPLGGNIPQINVTGLFTDPRNIAVSETDFIFITEAGSDSIAVLNNAGSLVNNFSLPFTPEGISVNDTSIFVSDWSSESIVTLDVNTGIPTGEVFNATTVFSNPKDIAVSDDSALIFVTEGLEEKVVQIRRDKGVVNEFNNFYDTSNATKGIALVPLREDVDFGCIPECKNLLFFNSTEGFVKNILNIFPHAVFDHFENSLLKEGINPADIDVNPINFQFAVKFVEGDNDHFLIAPTGLTFGPNGDLYVVNSNLASINRYNSTGFIENFVELDDQLQGTPAALKFGPDGNLYVSNQDNKRILQFNGTTGEFIDNFSSEWSPLDKPTGFTFGPPPDNTLYVVSSGTNNIFTFNGLTGDYILHNENILRPGEFVNTTSTENGGLSSPFDIVIAPNGELLVSSLDTGGVKRYDGTTGAYLGDFISDGSLSSPGGLALGLDNTIFVANQGNNTVMQFDLESGKLIGPFSFFDTSGPQFMALGPDEKLYVSSKGNHEIIRYGTEPVKYFVADWTTNDTKRIVGITSSGSKVPGIEYVLNDEDEPKHIATDSIGDIWITFTNGTNGKIVKVRGVDGSILKTIELDNIPVLITTSSSEFTTGSNTTMQVNPETGEEVEQIEVPKISINPNGIDLDSENNIYVSDWGNYRIVKLTNNGLFNETFKVNSTFIEPIDLAIEELHTDDFNIYVSENFTNNIIKINSDRVIKEFDLQNDVTTLNGITFDDNSIFVTSPPNGTIFEINATDHINEFSKLFTDPEGVSVFNSSSIFVTDWKDQRILNLDESGLRNQDPIDMRPAFFVSPIHLRDIEINDADPTNPDNRFLIWTADSRTASIANLTETNSTTPTFVIDKFRFDEVRTIADKFVFGSSVAVDSKENFIFASTKDNTLIKFNERGKLLANFTVDEMDQLIDVSVSTDSSQNDFYYLAIQNENEQFQKCPSGTSFNANGDCTANPPCPDGTDPAEGNQCTSFPLQCPFGFKEFGGISVATVCGKDSITETVKRNKILKFDSDLNLNNTSPILSEPPTSVSAYDNGTVYVSFAHNTLTQFDSSLNPTGVLLTIPDAGSISDIVIDSNDNLFAADKTEQRIHKILKDGTLAGWLGKCDTGQDCFEESKQSQGYSCTLATCTVVGDKFGNRAGQFNNPTDITVDKSGNLFVADAQKLPGKPISPRIQKFSDKGFFVQETLSDTDKSKLKGNFFLPKGIAVGSNNFYVIDNSTLHVFDINPFSGININKTSGFTSANVTYIANTGFIGNDTFTYIANDGFNASNIAQVNVTVGNCFIGSICSDVAIPENVGLDDFSDVRNGGTTEGLIQDIGGQIIRIMDARDPAKGVFIQASVTSNGFNPSAINVCNNSQVFATSGQQMFVTCDETKTTIESFRGNITVHFFDDMERRTIAHIPLGDIITFDVSEYQFIADKLNGNNVNTKVFFNDKNKKYIVEPNQLVKVDTAPPDLMSVCSGDLTLEAEITLGVERDHSTMQQNKIDSFLFFEVPDVDNGIPEGQTDITKLDLINDAPEIFPYDTSLIVNFTAIDEVGNEDKCQKILTVQDTIKPIIDLGSIPDELFFNTTEHDDSVKISYDLNGISAIDLRNRTGSFENIVDANKNPVVCIPYPGYTLNIGRHIVGCKVADFSDNFANDFFEIIVKKGGAVRIESVIASDEDASSDYSAGDKIIVQFSQFTNKPPATNASDIDGLLETSKPIGTGLTGIYLNPSRLEITIDDPSAMPPDGTTIFMFNASTGLTSASGVVGANLTHSVLLSGNFTEKAAPYISALIADDPVMFEGAETSMGLHLLDDQEYSINDTMTIRFSEATNTPGGLDLFDETEVTNFFDFSPHSPGDSFKGEWTNPSTFVVTVLQRNSMIDKDPILGKTTVTVNPGAQIKTADGNSMVSTSTSPPLTGNFGPFMAAKKIMESGTLTTTLPSGVIFEIYLPKETETSVITKWPDRESLDSIGDIIDLGLADGTCEAGCKVTFTFSTSDSPFGNHLLRIFHDTSGDTQFEQNEIVSTTIKEIAPGVFTATGIIFDTSLIGLGKIKRGGDSGDNTPPDFETISYTGVQTELADGTIGFGGILEQEIKFFNNMPTQIIETDKPAQARLILYENAGPLALEHITLYINLRGIERSIQDSDIYIRYNKGQPIDIEDPNGFLKDADISLNVRDQKLEVIFDMTFAKPMETSDVIIRAWDIYRNSNDVHFVDAIKVVSPTSPQVVEIPPLDITDQKVSEQKAFIPQEVFDKWAGYSEETLSDSELLAEIGIEADYIPNWYKKMASNWIKNGVVTYQEFADALYFLYESGILTP